MKTILGARSSASFLPLSFIAARRQSLFSSFFARHRATYHKCNCQSDSRCECEWQRVENSDQPAGYSRLKADSFAQLCGALLLQLRICAGCFSLISSQLLFHPHRRVLVRLPFFTPPAIFTVIRLFTLRLHSARQRSTAQCRSGQRFGLMLSDSM